MNKDYFNADIYRRLKRTGYTYLLLKYFRKAQFAQGFSCKIYRILYKILSTQHALEIYYIW